MGQSCENWLSVASAELGACHNQTAQFSNANIYFFLMAFESNVYVDLATFFKMFNCFSAIEKNLPIQINTNYYKLCEKQHRLETLYTACQSLLCLLTAGSATLYGHVMVIVLTLL